MQRICHENSIGGRKAQTGAPDIPRCLTNFDSVVMARHPRQSSLVQIDSMNRAARSQQVGKRHCEGAAAAAKITPRLRSRPFNQWCTDECGGLTDRHVFTVLPPVAHPRMPELSLSISALAMKRSLTPQEAARLNPRSRDLQKTQSWIGWATSCESFRLSRMPPMRK